jgi:hypothetical protein
MERAGVRRGTLAAYARRAGYLEWLRAARGERPPEGDEQPAGGGLRGVSTPAEHAELFKSPWVAHPGLLEQSMREARVNDGYTAELAAWCAEIHEHLRELAAALGIELLLMGGNGASLRFDAVAQRGSRDNDYLTAATPENIGRLMDSLGQRFVALGELMQPRPFEPKRPVRVLPLKTYVVPVPMLLNHGHSTNNEVKVEFHFERRLPPAQTVTGTLGPAGPPSITAALPNLNPRGNKRGFYPRPPSLIFTVWRRLRGQGAKSRRLFVRPSRERQRMCTLVDRCLLRLAKRGHRRRYNEGSSNPINGVLRCPNSRN